MAGNYAGHEPKIQARSELHEITPSTAREQYGAVRLDSPTSTTSSSEDTGQDSYQSLFAVFYDDSNF